MLPACRVRKAAGSNRPHGTRRGLQTSSRGMGEIWGLGESIQLHLSGSQHSSHVLEIAKGVESLEYPWNEGVDV